MVKFDFEGKLVVEVYHVGEHDYRGSQAKNYSMVNMGFELLAVDHYTNLFG